MNAVRRVIALLLPLLILVPATAFGQPSRSSAMKTKPDLSTH